MKAFIAFGSALLLVLIISQSYMHKTSEEQLLMKAQDFLNSLEAEQKKRAAFPFEDTERFNWHFVPRERKGLPLKHMDAQQRQAAHALMKASLSQEGYEKATNIMSLENILIALENRGPDDHYRDPLNYAFSIFGMPQKGEVWGWRLEGHHLSINFSSIDNKIVSATPTFFGSNPGKVPSGPKKGWRVLQPEEDLARELVQSFSESQKQSALIAEEAYPDIITGTERQVNIGQPEGIIFTAMDSKQQQKLMQLLQVYYDVYRSEVAGENIQKIKAKQNELHFAWAGGLNKGEPHYYRIQGPDFVIEYDNTQNNANHIHTVIRDLHNDFGADVLKAHYEEAHKE